MQVVVKGLQARQRHRAAVISIAPAQTQVIIFGGIDIKGEYLAHTTVLKFGMLLHAGRQRGNIMV